MKRYNRSDFEIISLVGKGTAAAFLGRNKITEKKGIYKDNDSMEGFSNEDVREKLVSQILNILDIDCASIDLVYDEKFNRNACFSNYIINDDEILVEPELNYEKISEDDVENFVENYINGVKKITSDETFHKSCRNNLYNYLYVACILDLYDVKEANLPIIQNIKTGENKVCPWFDFGISLKEDAFQRKYPFSKLSTDEVMNTLFEKHYDEIENLSNKTKDVLKIEKLEELLEQDYVKDSLSNEEINSIKSRIYSQVGKSNKLREKHNLISENSQKEKKSIVFFDKIKQKLNGIKNIFVRNKLLLLEESNLDKNNEEKSEMISNKSFNEEVEKLVYAVNNINYDKKSRLEEINQDISLNKKDERVDMKEI